MGLQPAAPQVVLHGPRSHLKIMRILYKLHNNLGRQSPSGLLPSGFPTKTMYATLPSPIVLHVLPVSVFLTSSPEWYLMISTEHKVPCYVVFSTPLLPAPSWAQISSSAPCSWKPSAYQPTFFSQCDRPSFTPILLSHCYSQGIVFNFLRLFSGHEVRTDAESAEWVFAPQLRKLQSEGLTDFQTSGSCLYEKW
jgi:hypothetical protein